MAEKLPDDDAGRHGDIHRVLGATLRYLQTAVTAVDHFLVHSLHLIAKYDGIVLFWVGTEVTQQGAALHLLHGIDKTTLGM